MSQCLFFPFAFLSPNKKAEALFLPAYPDSCRRGFSEIGVRFLLWPAAPPGIVLSKKRILR